MNSINKFKTSIKNRRGQKIVILVEEVKDAKGLAFVVHGLGGFKEQEHIETFTHAFLESRYSVVRYDASHSHNESDGEFEDATVTSYYHDFEDVMVWAKSQTWFIEPFCITGHSLGGLCAVLFANKNPNKVKALAPIATVVSGKLDSKSKPEELEKWKKNGIRTWESTSKPGLIKRLKWSYMEDKFKYNLLDNIERISMPVLMIVGEDDKSTPVDNQKLLYNALSCKKELHIIKNAPHTFKSKKHLKEIELIMKEWIASI